MAAGQSAAIAAGSLLTEYITGKSWREAAALGPGPIERELLTAGGELINQAAAAVASAFAVEALHRALEDAIAGSNFPLATVIDEETSLVSMSGGVDSSVACLLEKEAGKRVVGITMRLWSDPLCDEESALSCCSPRAIRDARAVCHELGVPHLTIDLRDEFVSAVVDDFVGQYSCGRTPNPCTRCNGAFRFSSLARLADMLGAARMTTGHYARITDSGSHPLIARGIDESKDQSYMLWGIEPQLLARVGFPLGNLTKDEVRSIARRASLPTSERPESQDICFIPDNDYRRFLRSRGKSIPAGEIVDRDGKRLGTHTGYIDYTVGQRRGLRVSAPQPLYVLETRPDCNQVVVGDRHQLAVNRVKLSSLNLFEPLRVGDSLRMQVRYNSAAVPAQVSEYDEESLIMSLSQPVDGVAVGQSAVLYDGEHLLAGGIITGSAPPARG